MGFLITAILVVNNFRDLANDRKAGKRTLAVRRGASFTVSEYTWLLVGSLLVPVIMWLGRQNSAIILLPWITIFQIKKLVRDLQLKKGAQLNATLADTARFSLLYAIIFSLGYLLDKLL